MQETRTAQVEPLRQLQVILRQNADTLKRDIIDGACRSYEEYRYKTGVLHGLGKAERELLDLDRLMMEE
jgi:hypothetical protein